MMEWWNIGKVKTDNVTIMSLSLTKSILIDPHPLNPLFQYSIIPSHHMNYFSPHSHLSVTPAILRDLRLAQKTRFYIMEPIYPQSPSEEQINFPPLAGGTNLPAIPSLARQAEGKK